MQPNFKNLNIDNPIYESRYNRFLLIRSIIALLVLGVLYAYGIHRNDYRTGSIIVGFFVILAVGYKPTFRFFELRDYTIFPTYFTYRNLIGITKTIHLRDLKSIHINTEFDVRYSAHNWFVYTTDKFGFLITYKNLKKHLYKVRLQDNSKFSTTLFGFIFKGLLVSKGNPEYQPEILDKFDSAYEKYLENPIYKTKLLEPYLLSYYLIINQASPLMKFLICAKIIDEAIKVRYEPDALEILIKEYFDIDKEKYKDDIVFKEMDETLNKLYNYSIKIARAQ